jgi:hypothetical protein
MKSSLLSIRTLFPIHDHRTYPTLHSPGIEEPAVAVPVPTLPGFVRSPGGWSCHAPQSRSVEMQEPHFEEWDALPEAGHFADEVWQGTLLYPWVTVPAITSVLVDLC